MGQFSGRAPRLPPPQPDQLPTAASDQRPRLPDRLSRTPCSAHPITLQPLRRMSLLRDRRHPRPIRPPTAQRPRPMQQYPMYSDRPSPPVAQQQPLHNPLFHPMPVPLAPPVPTHWPCNARMKQRERQADQICRTPLQRHQFNQRRGRHPRQCSDRLRIPLPRLPSVAHRMSPSRHRQPRPQCRCSANRHQPL